MPDSPIHSDKPLIAERISEGHPLRVLSFDGGGYLGLATASFLDGIEQHLGAALHQRFDLFCGTSTGAIIALAIACGRTGRDVVGLYERLGPAVFGRRQRGGPWLRAKFPMAPLHSALSAEFGARTLADIHAAGKAALITAFNLTTGQPRIFKTDHAPALTRDGALPLVDIALASAAAPTYFPVSHLTNPRENVRETFCDGGVAANHPGLLGFAEAVSTLRAAPAQVRLLSISTPRLNLGEGAASTRTPNRGLLAWARALPPIFIDANAALAHQVLRRIVDSYPEPRPAYVRIDMHNGDGWPMDCVSPEATAALKHTGITKAADGLTRTDVRRITD